MSSKLENYLKGLVEGKRNKPLDKLLLLILDFLEQFYKLLLFLRKILYRFGIIKKTTLESVVISIGNITAGGTGKTPVVKYLAGGLDNKGINTAVISRGYGSQTEGPLLVSDGCVETASYEEAGDEALMLSRLLEGFPIAIGKKRAAVGRLVQQRFKPDFILLDDGFQHWQLARDIDIVVIDGLNPFANWHLLPRGYLREPLTALNRGDIFIITRADLIAERQLKRIKEEISYYHKNPLIYTAIYKPIYLRFLDIAGESHIEPVDSYTAQKILAFSGLGNPVSFHQTLNKNGFNVVEIIEYPDHYCYREDDFDYIAEKASKEGIKLVLTTEKDAVKFKDKLISCLIQQGISLAVLGIELEVDNGGDLLDRLAAKMGSSN